jgi:prevent-host-death family protein
MIMKRARIAELKAKLSEYLRAVRRGETVTVMDRNTPIAVIVPFDAGPGGLSIRPTAQRTTAPAAVELPPPLQTDVDIVELLLDDRRADR